MRDTHICTIDSLRVGIDQTPMQCPICEKETMFMDYCGCRCDTCMADTSWDDDYAGFIRSIRNHTKLTRKEVAEKAGLKPSTIKAYEWKQPSKKYYEWFKGFIKDFYDQLGDEGLKAKKEKALKHDMKILDEMREEFNRKTK